MPTKFPRDFQDKHTTAEYQYEATCNKRRIDWLIILFLSRKKFSAKQIFVLSSAMKLGPAFSLGVSQHKYAQNNKHVKNWTQFSCEIKRKKYPCHWSCVLSDDWFLHLILRYRIQIRGKLHFSRKLSRYFWSEGAVFYIRLYYQQWCHCLLPSKFLCEQLLPIVSSLPLINYRVHYFDSNPGWSTIDLCLSRCHHLGHVPCVKSQ